MRFKPHHRSLLPHIPPELIIRILLYLSPHGIISCGRTCRMLHDLCGYPDLRYLVRMECCSVSDDLRSGLGYLERVQILENREEAWPTLDFRRSVQVFVERCCSAGDPPTWATNPQLGTPTLLFRRSQVFRIKI